MSWLVKDKFIISIDTNKIETQEFVLKEGVHIINDIYFYRYLDVSMALVFLVNDMNIKMRPRENFTLLFITNFKVTHD